MDYKKLLLSLLFLFVPISIAQIKVKEVTYKTKLKAATQRKFPNEGVVDMSINQLNNVVISNSPVDKQCIAYNAADDNYTNQTIGGFDFTSAMADPHQQLLIPVEQSNHTANVLFDFTTGTCPDNWGTNCWSRETNAIVGSVTPNAIDSNIVLLSETYIAYSASHTKRVCQIFIGSDTYQVGSVQHGLILGDRTEVQFSIISPNLPGTNWQDAKFGFCDGTFNPSMEDAGIQRVANKATLLKYLNIERFEPNTTNIYPSVKQMLIAGDNIDISSSDANTRITIAGRAPPVTSLTALNSRPTDLSTYSVNQVIPININDGEFDRVNQFTAFGHAVRLNTELTTSGNDSNLGASLVGSDKFGSITTVEGTNLSISNSPVLEIDFKVESSVYTIRVLLRKSDLESADLIRTPIYLAIYSGVPSETTYVDSVPVAKQSDITEDGIVMQSYTATITQSRYNSIKAQHDIDAELYAEFYESFTTYANRGSVFDVLDEKELKDFNKAPPVNTPRRVSRLPADDISLDRDEVYLTDDYTTASGVNITPETFSGTELDSVQNPDVSSGIGSRGWYNRQDADFTLGNITPNLPSDFVLISDTRVYVKRNTQTNLSKLKLGSTEYSLVRVPQSAGVKVVNNPDLAPSEPDIDYYTITGGLPAGDWDDLSFENAPVVSQAGQDVTFTKHIEHFGNVTRYNVSLSVNNANGPQSISLNYYTPERGSPNPPYTTANRFDLGCIRSLFPTTNSNYNIVALIIDGTELTFASSPLSQYGCFVTNDVTNASLRVTDSDLTKRVNIKFANNRLAFPGTSTPGDTIPATSTYTKGDYQFRDDDWGKSGYDAPPVNTTRDFTIPVKENRQGTRQDKNLLMASSGSNYTIANPFPTIQRLTFNADSSETDLLNRYSANISLTGFVDDKAPAILKIGTNNYSFAYFETDSGFAVYRTPIITANTSVNGTNFVTTGNSNVVNIPITGALYGRSRTNLIERNLLVFQFCFSPSNCRTGRSGFSVNANTYSIIDTDESRNIYKDISGTNEISAIVINNIEYPLITTQPERYETAVIPSDARPTAGDTLRVNIKFTDGTYLYPIISSGDRISEETTINNVNIQNRAGVWLGQSGESSVIRTIDKATLTSITGGAIGIHVPPANPSDGTRIRMLSDYIIAGGAVMTASEATGTASGLYTGYLQDSSYTIGTGDLGSLVPPNANFNGLLSYSGAHSNNQYANKTTFQDSGTNYTPRYVFINGVRYALTNITANDYWSLNGLDGSFIKAGHRYFVNVENTAGVKMYPNVTLEQGKIYFYDGLTWREEKTGLDQTEVDARVNALTSDWAKKSNTDYVPATKICQEMTQAQYTALSPKVANQLYCIIN